LYPLSANVSFGEITDGVMPVSRLKLPLLKFHAVHSDDEDVITFLVRVELEAENFVGSYSHLKHDASTKSLPNGGQLNRVFVLWWDKYIYS
jgi:hypothetical protein